ncbi:MAG TPA: acyl-CoA dehydrogenase [Saprospiraceae bacterium]|nr:acyl-CoA dehydrogenase [Saprospiraceae bacterium]
MSRYTSMEHLRFLLFEVHGIQDLFTYEYFAHLDPEQVTLMIDSAKALADRDMYPFFKEMDEQPVHYAGEGKVWSHPQLRTIIQNAAEQNWINGQYPFDLGGLQLPQMVYNAAHHIFQAANNGAQGYISLTTGAARLIHDYGTSELIETFLPPMFDGRWQGTMALTEPQAGSALTDITTVATPTESGYYHIKGQKIFISAGEHMACENFVHLTLARIAGAPPGLKGVSLFVIPKHRPTAGGGLEYNDVFCAGDYQKLGQRAYATTHLVFGEHDNCRGWLVGEPHKGLSYMFQLMNEARIGVGQTAASVAMAAYQASLQYARERSQGRKPGEKDPLKPPVPIIQHADVQRMLFTQKAIVEGSLSLAMECNRLADLVHVTEGEEQRPHWLLLEILTPIVKTYSSEQGNRSASLAIQVLGGYGYTVDFPVQQYYRDLRIMAIYEGTTGIQSLDLLGRKMTMENGAALTALAQHIDITIRTAAAHPVLQAQAAILQAEMERLGKTLRQLGKFAQSGNPERYLADATVFMEMAGYVVIAWQWLKMAVAAQIALDAADFSTQSKSFYEGKIHTMQFFFRYELPHAAACAEVLLAPGELTMLEEDERLD